MRQETCDKLRTAVTRIRKEEQQSDPESPYPIWEGAYPTDVLHKDIEGIDCDGQLTITYIEDIVEYIELSCTLCKVDDLMADYADLGLDALAFDK